MRSGWRDEGFDYSGRYALGSVHVEAIIYGDDGACGKFYPIEKTD
jgi:hypothetical protein